MYDPILVTHEELYKNYLKNNLRKEKPFRVPTKTGIKVIDSEELIDWIIEIQSKDELKNLVEMIRLIKKRNMPIRPMFQIIAIGLINLIWNFKY